MVIMKKRKKRKREWIVGKHVIIKAYIGDTLHTFEGKVKRAKGSFIVIETDEDMIGINVTNIPFIKIIKKK